MQLKPLKYIMYMVIIGVYLCSCNYKQAPAVVVYKGVYSLGPEVRSFKDCDSGHEFWVTDNSGQLELKYLQLNFEKPYVPVYVEVQGTKVRSGKDGMGSEFDSTLIVKKVVKITEDIPQDMCN